MSEIASRGTDPGLFIGIVLRIRSDKSPRVEPVQFDRKSPPTSEGVISEPQWDCWPCFERVNGEKARERGLSRVSPALLLRRRQTKSNVIARVVAATDGHDDVLLAINSVGHGRTALRGWHPDRSHLLTGLLIVGAQHSPARMVSRRRDLRVTHDDQSLGHHQPDIALLASLGNVQPLECRVNSN